MTAQEEAEQKELLTERRHITEDYDLGRFTTPAPGRASWRRVGVSIRNRHEHINHSSQP